MRDGSSWLSRNRASRANDPEFISDDFIENLMVECIQRLFPITLLERDREHGYYTLASSWQLVKLHTQRETTMLKRDDMVL